MGANARRAAAMTLFRLALPACLLSVFSVVDGFSMYTQHSVHAARGWRSGSATALAYRTMEGGSTLTVHTTFDDEKAETSADGNDSTAELDALLQKRPCGMCSHCTCGKKSRSGATPTMMATESQEVPFWEYRQVIESESYFTSIMEEESNALRTLQLF